MTKRSNEMPRNRPRPLVMTIGTTDPWNAAGIGRDLMTFAECGVRGAAVVAAVSAQDGAGAFALHALPRAIIEAQFDALRALPVAAYRVGALPNAEAVKAVAARLREVERPVVYDPVLAASAGGRFAGAGTLGAIVGELLPCVTILTPNVREAEELLGKPVRDEVAMARAAVELVERGAKAALVTGGDLPGKPLDVLFDGSTEIYRGERIEVAMRGTGCLLAAAVAASLAGQATLRDAVRAGRAYVRTKLERAIVLGGATVAE